MIQTQEQRHSALLEAALRYVEQGFYVAAYHHVKDDQSCSCGGNPCLSKPGKHPRYDKDLFPHGIRSATNDPVKVKELWRRWPLANIGLACGPKSNLLGLDVDPAHGGNESLAELEMSYGKLPHTIEAITGGGGRHILFEWPDVSVKNSVSEIAPGLDIRADGGGLLVEPSNHISGQCYYWELSHHPDETPLAKPPDWLIALCQKADGPQDTSTSDDDDDFVYKGQRHNALFKKASSMRGIDFPYDIALNALLNYNQEKCVPPWSDQEVEKLVADVFKRYQPNTSKNGHHPDDDGARMCVGKQSPKPDIRVNHEIKRYVDEGSAAIKDDDALFQRDGLIVTIQEIARKARTEHEGNPIVPRIIIASDDFIREIASERANWSIFDARAKKPKQVAAPMSFVRHLKGRPKLPFRVLVGIKSVPTLRRDGSVVDHPGYDAVTGLFYNPTRDYPPIFHAPTKDDAIAAYDILVDVFHDFPFVEEFHRVAAVAAILSIVVRHLVRTVPLFAVSANVRGSGKGLLVTIIALIATGKDAPKWDEVLDPEEERKRLLVIAMDGDTVTCIDNVTQPLGSGPLDRAITEPYAKGRILGVSKSAEVELDTTFFATGNNMRFRGDMARRVIPISISPNVERPEEREDFKYPDLQNWVMEHHPELLVAALTILKAYIQAGKPKQDIKQYGSFEQWSDLVRSALVWLGKPDPCEARKEIEAESDEAYDNLRELLYAWLTCYGKNEKKFLVDVLDDIKRSSTDDDMRRKWETLGAALDIYCKARGDNPGSKAKSIAHHLPGGPNGSRIIDGMRLRSQRHGHTKTLQWWVEMQGDTMTEGEDGVVF